MSGNSCPECYNHTRDNWDVDFATDSDEWRDRVADVCVTWVVLSVKLLINCKVTGLCALMCTAVGNVYVLSCDVSLCILLA